VVETPIRPDAALLYRLNGDYNPLHSDPDVAKAAGFERPVLHGLCTFGMAALAVLREVGDDKPENLRRLDVRFSAPILPGCTLRTEIWRNGDGSAAFRASIVETGTMVLNNGLAVFA
jgi:acyl dehydratase